MCLFFFFKQKTAYEMRISDWSSDVCSSDLLTEQGGRTPVIGLGGAELAGEPLEQRGSDDRVVELEERAPSLDLGVVLGEVTRVLYGAGGDARALQQIYELVLVTVAGPGRQRCVELVGVGHRSEEHTSELQSLMRIS